MHIFGIGFCPCCHRFSFSIKKRPRKTAYVDEACNWLLSCISCKKDDDEHYEDLWFYYYSTRL